MVKRVLFVLLVLAVFVTPVLAQESPPAAPEVMTRTEIIFIGAMFVLMTLMVVAGLLLKSYADKLFAALPPWAEDLIIDLLRRVEDELSRIAEETPNEVDDSLVDEIRRLVDTLIEREGLAKPPE